MKKRAFTLVELLAVIVILAIILAIAIPHITGVVQNASRTTFEENAKMVIKTIDLKVASDSDFIPTDVDVDNVDDLLNLSNANYSKIVVSMDNNKSNVCIVGQNKWNGLVAKGSYDSIEVVDGSDCGISEATADSCFTFDSGTGTITKYDYENSSCPTDVVIPKTIGGVSVLHIGRNAFNGPIGQYCYDGVDDNEVDLDYVHTDEDGYLDCWFDYEDYSFPITSVIIPSTVTTIGAAAFEYNQLTSISIPDSVTNIGYYAFDGNILSSLTLGNNMKTIGPFVFAYNQLQSLIIPDSVTNISDSAFISNILSSLTLGTGITTIGPSAFSSNELESVTIPNGITSIEPYIFAYNELKSVTIPNSITSIGEHAFYYNDLSSVTLGNSVTTIGSNSFASNQITSITIPSSVTDIGELAFYGNHLTGIIIPNNVTSIGKLAFEGNGITSITIPNTAINIGGGAFNRNLLLTEEAFIYSKNSDGSENTANLVSYGGYKYNNIVIPSTVTKIDDYAFYNCFIYSVTIPSSVSIIGENAFNNNHLTSITIPSSVTTIEDKAFFDNELTRIVMGRAGIVVSDYLLSSSNNYFKTAYQSGGAGTYIGTQYGTWTKQ